MNKKNQWVITAIENKNGINPLGFQKKLSQTQNEILKSLCRTCFSNKFRNIASQAAKGGLTVLISVLIIFTIVKAAGSLTPSASPAATSYTLTDIYTRLTTENNAISTAGDHSFAPGASPAGTLYSLTEIYDKIPIIEANTVKLNTRYLGVDGTLVPSGGNATTANVCASNTFFGSGQADWNLQTGALNPTASAIISGNTYCGVAGTAVASPTYGDNDASKVLTIAGNSGTYNATNLSAENVRNAIAFGVGQTGTFSVGYTYGSDTASGVLTTAAGTPGTYNISNLSNSVIKQNTTWGVSLGSTGTLTPDGGTAGVADLFSGKTANLTNDWTLDTGALNLACNTASFDGAGNIVANAYDGTGSGLNRWCMTDSGDAATSDILSGKVGWADGLAITGAMANIGAQTITPTTTNTAITQGYHDGAGYCAGDADLTASNIKKSVNLFGVAGTYSGYPGTAWAGSGGPTNAATCEANAGWYWFEDANGDGDATDPEDGVCVQASPITAVWSWNGAEQVVPNTLAATAITAGSSNSVAGTWAAGATNAYKNHLARVEVGAGAAIDCWGRVKSSDASTIIVYGSWLTSAYAACATAPGVNNTVRIIDDDKYDNSWIGDWTCSTGSTSLNGAVSWGSYPTSTVVGGTNHIALAMADCYDGVRDLLPIVNESINDSRIVYSGTAEAGGATTITDNDAAFDANVWIGEKVKIFAGASAGSSGIIESNTATVLTVGSWSAGNPDSTSQYGIIYIVPHANYRPTISTVATENDGPLTQEVLNNWKGARLPSASDFFGVCGSAGTLVSGDYRTGCSSNKTFGNYGGQVGRTGECLSRANSGSWEWLSEQHYNYYARVAGSNACSYFYSSYVSIGYRFRAVFRP